jgi:hypothetical protein
MPPQVVIAGIYTSAGANADPPGSEDEFLVLVNVGDEPADLRGWSLTNRKQDQRHHYRYLLPRFLSGGDPWELEPGGLVFIHTGRGQSGATATPGEAHHYHFYQHRSVRVWADAGDTACLHDRTGQVVAWYSLPVRPVA